MKWKYITFVSGACLMLIVSTGCDPDYVGGSSTTEVVGRVLLDGQPIEDAKVVFVPFKSYGAARRQKELSYATTDAQGNFTLSKANGDVGAELGLHRVIISKSTSGGSANEDPETTNPLDDVIAADAGDFWQFLSQPADELIPVIYNKQSTLTFDVDSSPGTVQANFDLSSVDPLLETGK